MEPWRYSVRGISVSLRVTPRGGRDGIDGIETLANGQAVVKVRVRAIARDASARGPYRHVRHFLFVEGRRHRERDRRVDAAKDDRDLFARDQLARAVRQCRHTAI